MNEEFDLRGLMTSDIEAVLDNIGDAVLVLDEQRTLRYVNTRARLILGYSDDEPLGGRCKLTTRGVDCQNACPLSFVLEGDIDCVQEFQAVYRTREGDPIPLLVTVIPFIKDDGSFGGAVEILRPTDPDPGFFAVGRGKRSVTLRQDISRLAGSGEPIVLVGEAPATADVAATIHRFSGLPDELFLKWNGSWDGVTQWPPGTVYDVGEEAVSLLKAPAVKGWQVIVGVVSLAGIDEEHLSRAEVLQLPKIRDIEADLPIVVKAWVAQLKPATKIAPKAMARLCEIAMERGLTALQGVLHAVVETADGRIEAEDLEFDGFRSICVDELLEADDPFATLEKRLLFEVLERHHWRMQDAAERLGISRVTLWRKLKERNVERP